MDNSSHGDAGANTLLIVVILVILVGFGAWWLTATQAGPATQENAAFDVNVKLPSRDGSANDSAE